MKNKNNDFKFIIFCLCFLLLVFVDILIYQFNPFYLFLTFITSVIIIIVLVLHYCRKGNQHG